MIEKVLELSGIRDIISKNIEDVCKKVQEWYGVESDDIVPLDSLNLYCKIDDLSCSIFQFVEKQKRLPAGSVTRTWRVYGTSEASAPSFSYDYSDENGPRITVRNSDIHREAYSEISITADTADACERAFFEQLYDGVYEEEAYPFKEFVEVKEI